MPTALILGGAQCVWQDAVNALRLFTPDAVFAVNDMIAEWPGRLDYAVSLHPDKLSVFVRAREQHGYSSGFQTWAHKASARDGVQKTTADWRGSSSLLAVKIAIVEEKFDAVVLAGVPMSKEQGHFKRRKPWTSAEMYRKGWHLHLGEIAPYVRSLSGWTRELLGEPTPTWLSERGSTLTVEQGLLHELEKMAGCHCKSEPGIGSNPEPGIGSARMGA